MLPMSASLSGGSSSAKSDTSTGDTGGGSSAGMKSGSFINNFAGPGAHLTSKADNSDSPLPASAGSIGLLVAGAGVLLVALTKGRHR